LARTRDTSDIWHPFDPLNQRQLIEGHVDGRSLGISGSPHLSVPSFNMALDACPAS
jgi:hypothetical protein